MQYQVDKRMFCQNQPAKMQMKIKPSDCDKTMRNKH